MNNLKRLIFEKTKLLVKKGHKIEEACKITGLKNGCYRYWISKEQPQIKKLSVNERIKTLEKYFSKK